MMLTTTTKPQADRKTKIQCREYNSPLILIKWEKTIIKMMGKFTGTTALEACLDSLPRYQRPTHQSPREMEASERLLIESRQSRDKGEFKAILGQEVAVKEATLAREAKPREIMPMPHNKVGILEVIKR